MKNQQTKPHDWWFSPTAKRLIAHIEDSDRPGWLEGAILLCGVTVETHKAIRTRLKLLRRHTRDTLRGEAIGYPSGKLIVMIAALAGGRVPRDSIDHYVKSRMVLAGSNIALGLFVDSSVKESPVDVSVYVAERESMPSEVAARDYLPVDTPLDI